MAQSLDYGYIIHNYPILGKQCGKKEVSCFILFLITAITSTGGDDLNKGMSTWGFCQNACAGVRAEG